MMKYYDVWSAIMTKARDKTDADRYYLGTEVRIRGKWRPFRLQDPSAKNISAYKIKKAGLF